MGSMKGGVPLGAVGGQPRPGPARRGDMTKLTNATTGRRLPG
jgi:hypothetical protein